jgi:hypothetical protein
MYSSFEKNILLIVATLAIIVATTCFVLCITMEPKVPETDNIHKLLVISSEWGYFHGQKDALAGNRQIAFDTLADTWYWIGTPFTDGRQPTYDPRMGLVKSVKFNNLVIPKGEK